MEDLYYKKSFEWILEVYERVTRDKQNTMKITAMLTRQKNGVLAGFAEERIPSDTTPPPSSVNQIQQISGIRYNRK